MSEKQDVHPFGLPPWDGNATFNAGLPSHLAGPPALPWWTHHCGSCKQPILWPTGVAMSRREVRDFGHLCELCGVLLCAASRCRHWSERYRELCDRCGCREDAREQGE